MRKQVVAVCPRCDEKTKHNVLECNDSLANRVVETVFSLGWALTNKREYECECQKCGKIHTVEF